MFTDKRHFINLILLVFFSLLGHAYLTSSRVPNDRILRGIRKPLRHSSKTFGNYFLNIFDKHLDFPVIIDGDTGVQVTYRQLKENSIRFAAWVRSQNIESNEVIAVINDPRINDYVPILASLFEGIICSHWPEIFTLESARYYLEITRPKIVVYIKGVEDTLKQACELEKQSPILILWDPVTQNDHNVQSIENLMASIPADQVEKYTPKELKSLDDIALIMFTTGSTGPPKGVAHSYNSVLNNFIEDIPITYPNQKGRPTVVTHRISSWVDLSFFISTLNRGGLRILHKFQNPAETVKVVDKYHVNFMFLFPTEMINYVQSGVLKDHLESIEDFMTGGSSVNPESFEEFKSNLRPNVVLRGCWGLTEAAHSATCNLGHKLRENVTADPVGFPLPNTEIKIVDLDSGESLGPNEIGEIVVRRPYVFTGYYNNPEKTRAALDNQGWLRSGDLGYYDENGELFVVDRMKNVIKFQGHRVFPGEIEFVLRRHPAVLEAIVVSVPDKIDGDRPIAFVVKRPGKEVTTKSLVELSATLGHHKTLWGGVQFLEKFPLTWNKKIDKIKLKAMVKRYER